MALGAEGQTHTQIYTQGLFTRGAINSFCFFYDLKVIISNFNMVVIIIKVMPPLCRHMLSTTISKSSQVRRKPSLCRHKPS